MSRVMRASVRATVIVFTVLVLTFGTTLLVQALIDYFNGESQDGAAFAYMLLATCLIAFPLSLYFIYQTFTAYRRQESTYSLPEPPARLFLLLSVSGILSLVTLLSLTMYVIFITAS